MTPTEELFVVAAVWTLIAVAVARFIPNWPGRITFVAVAVAIPFWELPYGYYNFQELCERHGGLKVFERFAPQQTVCASYPLDTSAAQLLANGLVGVEARDESGRIRRHGAGLSSQEGKAEGSQVSSTFCVTQAFVNGLPWRIQRNEHLIVGARDQRIAARFSDYVWFGTWWQQQALPVLGRGGECRHGDAVKAIAGVLLTGAK